MTEIIRVPPAFSFFRAMQNENIELVTCLSELVDNAMGAHATRVLIDHRGHELEVKDDGVGEEDISVFFQIGASGKRKRAATDPQRYGVGLANVFASMGDELVVETIHAGVLRKGWTSAAMMETKGDFVAEIDDPVPAPGSGTTVLVRGIDARRFVQSGNDVIAREIGMTYYPALEAGKLIEYRRKGQNVRIKPWAKPRCRKKTEKQVDLGHGRIVDVSAGIIQDGEKEPPRGSFIVTLGPRVLEMSGGYARNYFTSGFFCELKLEGRGWKLQKNKRGLMPEERTALEDAVFPVYEALLAECSERARNVVLGDIGLKVTEKLFADIPHHKRVQSPVENPGLTRPTPIQKRGPQTFVTRDNQRIDGEKLFKSGFRRLSKCQVGEWIGATRDMDPYRSECTQQYLKLYLNTAHPYFADLMKKGNKAVLEAMVYGIASFERAHEDTTAKAPLYGGDALRRAFMANLGRVALIAERAEEHSEEVA